MIAGRLLEVRADERTTATTAAVAAGATSIPVDDVTPFGDDGGQVDIAGTVYDYTGVDTSAVNADGEGGVLLLSSGLAAAADEFSLVSELIGTAVAVDFYAVVDLGTDDEASHHVEVPLVTREERLAWPVQVYDPPLPVSLSGDLEQIVAAPGVQPDFTGTITGSLLRTAESGPRIEISDPSIRFYSLADAPTATLTPLNDGFQMTGVLYVPVVMANQHVETPIVYTDEVQGSTGTYVTTYELRATNAVVAPRFITTDPSFAAAGTSPNTYISTGGEIAKVPPSAAKYKHNIVDVELDADAVVALRPVEFEYLPEVGAGDGMVVGFIADEADALGLGNWVEHGPDGAVENFAYMRWPAAQQVVLRDHHRRVADLEQTVADLAARLAKLEKTGGAA